MVILFLNHRTVQNIAHIVQLFSSFYKDNVFGIKNEKCDIGYRVQYFFNVQLEVEESLWTFTNKIKVYVFQIRFNCLVLIKKIVAKRMEQLRLQLLATICCLWNFHSVCVWRPWKRNKEHCKSEQNTLSLTFVSPYRNHSTLLIK